MSEVPEPFDSDKVEPAPLTTLCQAIADRVHDVVFCSNEDTMWVLWDLWDNGFRVVKHPWLKP